mgnify:CR=1 FL=1
MEAVLNAPHDLIVREYLSEFVNENVMPPVETEALHHYICSFSCPTSPTSPTTSLSTYPRISLILAGCRARPRRATQGRNWKYRDV